MSDEEDTVLLAPLAPGACCYVCRRPAAVDWEIAGPLCEDDYWRQRDALSEIAQLVRPVGRDT